MPVQIANCDRQCQYLTTGGVMQSQFIILALDSADMGGIETHVLTLASQLAERGRRVKVCFFKRYQGHPMYDMLAKAHIEFGFAGGVEGFWRYLRAHRGVAQLHTHGYKAGVVGRVFAKWLDIPVVSTFHSGDLGQGKLRLYSMLDLFTARLGKAIAVSNDIRERLPKNTQVIPNFVPLQALRSVNQGVRYQANIGFVGRLSHEKGPDNFCKLAESCADLGVQFTLYGDGPMRSDLTAKWGHVTKFKGRVPMAEYWHEVDVLCISFPC